MGIDKYLNLLDGLLANIPQFSLILMGMLLLVAFFVTGTPRHSKLKAFQYSQRGLSVWQIIIAVLLITDLGALILLLQGRLF